MHFLKKSLAVAVLACFLGIAPTAFASDASADSCTSDCTSGASVASHKCDNYDPATQNLDQWQGTWSSVGDDLAKLKGDPYDQGFKIGAKGRSDKKKDCWTPEKYREKRVGKYSSRNYGLKDTLMKMTIKGMNITFEYADGSTESHEYEPFTKTTGCHGSHSEVVYGFKSKDEAGKLNIIAFQDVYKGENVASHFKVQFFSEDDGNLAAFGPNVHELGFPKYYDANTSALEKANLILAFGMKKTAYASEDELKKAADELEPSKYCKADDGSAVTPDATSGDKDPKGSKAKGSKGSAAGSKDCKSGKCKDSKKKLPTTSDQAPVVPVALGLMGVALVAAAVRKEMKA